jgi:hypothetical protein
MRYLELALLFVGLVTVVVGYRKNHRNLMLCAAVALFLAGTVGDFSHGFHDGFNAGWLSSTANR